MSSPPSFEQWLWREYGEFLSPAPAPVPLPPPLPIEMVYGIPFSGPVPLSGAPDRFMNLRGIYLVTMLDRGTETVVYVGISGSEAGIGNRIASHHWRDRWKRLARGRPLRVYAHIETDADERLKKEAFLFVRLNPICGYL